MVDSEKILKKLESLGDLSRQELQYLKACVVTSNLDSILSKSVENIEDQEVKAYLQGSIGRTFFDKLSTRSLPAGTTGRLQTALPLRRLLMSVSTNWGFDSLHLSQITKGNSIYQLLPFVFQDAGLYDALSLSPESVQQFSKMIEKTYLDNPYHGTAHVTGVIQTLHMILTDGGVLDSICSPSNSALVLAAAYVAAAGHDAGHRGVTNDCLVNMNDGLADMYNDTSCNENYHCRITLNVMQKSGIFASLPEESGRFIRKLVIEMILKTDMKYHSSVCKDFLSVGHPPNTGDAIFTVLPLCIKCADLAHVTLPWKQHREWVKRLEQEFFLQGDAERNKGIRISPMMDRTKPGVSAAQIGFLENVALPLYEYLTGTFPDCSPLLQGLKVNLKLWQSQIQNSKVGVSVQETK